MDTQKTQVWIKRKGNKPFYETGELVEITDTEIKVKDYETEEIISYDRTFFYALKVCSLTNHKKRGINFPHSYSK